MASKTTAKEIMEGVREEEEGAMEMPLQQRRIFASEPHLHVENKWTFRVCTAEETVYTICLRVANVITHSKYAA